MCRTRLSKPGLLNRNRLLGDGGGGGGGGEALRLHLAVMEMLLHLYIYATVLMLQLMRSGRQLADSCTPYTLRSAVAD